jgi:hypothetical protein
MSDNACMANVPIYVALITAGTGIIAAAVPQAGIIFWNVRQDMQDRRDRQAAAARRACVRLLRAAGDLRTQVANNGSFQGDREIMAGRLEEVRKHAAAARLSAVEVGMLIPGSLAHSAERLAEAAAVFAHAAEQNTDLDLGRMVADPDYRELDACADAFRGQALAKAARA